jgi:hypothetical protein
VDEPEVALLPDELGVDDEAPPPDWLFSWSEVVEDELDDGDELDGVDGDAPMLELDDDEPEGEVDGVEVAPLEDEPEGEVDGLVVVDEDDPVAPPLSPARSHAVSRVAPSAMETAIASVESLIVASVVG